MEEKEIDVDEMLLALGFPKMLPPPGPLGIKNRPLLPPEESTDPFGRPLLPQPEDPTDDSDPWMP